MLVFCKVEYFLWNDGGPDFFPSPILCWCYVVISILVVVLQGANQLFSNSDIAQTVMVVFESSMLLTHDNVLLFVFDMLESYNLYSLYGKIQTATFLMDLSAILNLIMLLLTYGMLTLLHVGGYAEDVQQRNRMKLQQRSPQITLDTSTDSSVVAEQASTVPATRMASAFPAYWHLRHEDDADCCFDVTAEWKERMQELISTTCKAEGVGKGRMNSNIGHTYLVVDRVLRIENHLSWKAYSWQRDVVAEQLKKNGVKQEPTAVATARSWMHQSLQLHEGSNEVLLLHGTPAEQVSKIVEEGMLDERMFSSGGIFGGGIYLAENSSKADEYCDPDPDGSCWMFLVRTVLGQPFMALAPRRDSRRPPRIEGTPRLYDSVIGLSRQQAPRACRGIHREFVVYDRRQAYAEFLIGQSVPVSFQYKNNQDGRGEQEKEQDQDQDQAQAQDQDQKQDQDQDQEQDQDQHQEQEQEQEQEPSKWRDSTKKFVVSVRL
ncbi:hypothetical protein GUITHDRAFT_107301 [Guillardia theta CCMP2712]|uniref:Poly [ADP-ribose] polymerase n=1 Tax=Guillardia theta (strain CCMP2712) TaxID=905079 RepID=L1JFS3_GUITC|nr:hypothetical protein GUITHDRAFT_107301 [Guillardia theta CCMP2712]EKX46950.1 hypothetical protein GUITHDRAFT_107301 [Guillardia theta CCMP2712]|eukprot:XP_005833930.1 hypothetical protein GUITHDRAFT_107301 [Guillardia theta CCMP2712]